jgi:hypothetical protein
MYCNRVGRVGAMRTSEKSYSPTLGEQSHSPGPLPLGRERGHREEEDKHVDEPLAIYR